MCIISRPIDVIIPLRDHKVVLDTKPYWDCDPRVQSSRIDNSHPALYAWRCLLLHKALTVNHIVHCFPAVLISASCGLDNEEHWDVFELHM